MRASRLSYRPLLLLLLLSGCETRQTVETELRMAELEAQVAELETQLDNAWTQMFRLSGELSANVRDLEAALSDVNRRVLDLPGGDPQFTVPEVEAAVAVATQRLARVRETTNEIGAYLQ